jgi:hypothetical protein
MLTITLDLPPEKEQELTEKIEQRDAEGVRQIIASAWDTMQVRKTTPPQRLSKEEFAKQLDEFAAFIESVLPPGAGALPDEALTRESMYEGRPKI